jgi:hypothetical protein
METPTAGDRGIMISIDTCFSLLIMVRIDNPMKTGIKKAAYGFLSP